MTTPTILIVENDPNTARMLSRILKREGYLAPAVGTLAAAYRAYDESVPEIVLLDFELDDGTALDFLHWAEERNITAAVFVMTGYGSIERAVECVKHGADQFLTKPMDRSALRVLVGRTLENRRRGRQVAAHQFLQERGRAWPFLGESPAIKRIEELARSVVESEVPVLVLGETGSGKGILAQWLHDHGPRAHECFVDLTCAGLSKELAESELFGHERGSFTGATADKKGLIEIAHRGTLFLDEIGDLDVSVQPKLLKVLEERAFRKLGGVQNLTTDLRLISATHRDLSSMARAGEFRNDLLFRINTIVFDLPPLRERPEDIVPIANAMLATLGRGHLGRSLTLTKEAEAVLVAYEWPGNLRELRNVLERAAIFTKDGSIGPSALMLRPPTNSSQAPTIPARMSLAEAERWYVLDTLRNCTGNVTEACQILGIPRSSLYLKLKRWGVRSEES